MSNHLKLCEIDPKLKSKLNDFRVRKEKNVAALILKIDPEKLLVIEDESFEDVTIEELAAEIPEHLPRYVVLSYVHNHSDGRISYPLCFIFITPTSKPELQMLYAGSKLEVQNELGLTKAFDLKSVEDFSEEWLLKKLALFR